MRCRSCLHVLCLTEILTAECVWVLQLPQDFTQLFDNELFKFDTNLIPDAVRERTHAHLSLHGLLLIVDSLQVALRKLLRMGEKPLDLITPQLELVQPALTPAVFPGNHLL